MKLELIKDKGKTVGWTLIAETEDEKLKLGSIRNLEFWGSSDDKPVYDGIKCEPGPGGQDYVVQLSYATRAYKKTRDEEFRKTLHDNEAPKTD